MSVPISAAAADIAVSETALTPLGAEMVGELGVQAQVAFGELTLIAERERIVDVMTALRDRFGFQQLIDVCGADYPDRAERFEVVYHLLSLTRAARVRVKVSTDEVKPVPSVSSVYPAANWFEREVFDMFHPVLGAPGPAPHLDGLWLPWPSAAQGFSDHRLCRGAV